MKRGSALLIVLGMTAFIVVSAVSFSIYMRGSRLPSSQLRRQVSARYILRAALANAIDRLEARGVSEGALDMSFGYDEDRRRNARDDDSVSGIEGIGNDVYPGLRVVADDANAQNNAENRGGNYDVQAGDRWVDRVFMPFGEVSPDKTVSTLTLEGLAYLPPAIVNDVRVASRKTWTAMWRNLPYEFGRYAFCAVDVSDCYDVNRLGKGAIDLKKVESGDGCVRRTSGTPVSLASMFHGDPSMALDFYQKFEAGLKISQDGASAYYTSVADLNLAFGKTGFTPFCNYIGLANGTSPYTGSASEIQALTNALFITDTWFPSTDDAAVTTYSLAKHDDQPFVSFAKGRGALDIVEGDGLLSDFGRKLADVIDNMGMCSLHDYLDADSIPLSFCQPTVEVVPMVSGIGLLHHEAVKPKIVKTTHQGFFDKPRKEGKKTTEYKRTAIGYALTDLADQPIDVTGTLLFPFRRAALKGYKTKFEGDAIVRVWWAPDDIPCRLPVGSALRPAKADWNLSQPDVRDGVITVCEKGITVNLTVKDEPAKMEEAVGTFAASIDLSQGIPEMPLFWHVTDETIETDEETGTTVTKSKEAYYTLDGVKKDKPFVPHEKDGSVAAWWAGIAAGATGPQPPDADRLIKPKDLSRASTVGELNDTKYVMHLAVWVRLRDGSDVIDIAPACFADDADYLAAGSGGALDDRYDPDFGGDCTPILEFRGQQAISFAKDDGGAGVAPLIDNQTAETFSLWDSFECPDPRYNWAPENWVPVRSGAPDGADLKKEDWLDLFWNTASGSKLSGSTDRDRDLFLFVSDQQYLQSIGELAFLPRSSDLLDKFGNIDGWAGFADRVGDINGCACHSLFWRSYPLLGDSFYEFKDFKVESVASGFRLNPFSSDPRVIRTAFADTPLDYFVASTNVDSEVRKNWKKPTKLTDWMDYAFNTQTADKLGSAFALDDEIIGWIADRWPSDIRSAVKDGVTDWRTFYDSRGWFSGGGDEQTEFLGIDLGTASGNVSLYGVDRKFLHSFWRDCFQNRQQLFLIFLRSEPLSVGGASGDSVGNAQLGARGVALVWRDPLSPQAPAGQQKDAQDNSAPHRTRVLFYHQFD